MDMDGYGVCSRRRLIAGSPLLAVGTAGCMRFATSSSASFDVSIADVTVPTTGRLHEDVTLRSRLQNDSAAVVEGTVVVALDDRTAARESVTLEPESETTVETEITPTEPGEHELGVAVENEAGESFDRWSETLVVTGRRLTFEWDETFVPAEHAADSTRHLAYACFLLRFRDGDTVLEEAEIGADGNVEFVAGAYPVDSVTDPLLDRFYGEPGRWLGTEDERTTLVVPDSDLLERTETLELHGYSLFETETTVRVRHRDTAIDTAAVPPRDEGESVLEVDLSDYESGS